MYAIAKIGVVYIDYDGGEFITNNAQWKPKEVGSLTIPAENVEPIPATSSLRGPDTAFAGPILLDFLFKTHTSLLDKVIKFQICTPNRSRAAIEKTPVAESASPARNAWNGMEIIH